MARNINILLFNRGNTYGRARFDSQLINYISRRNERLKISFASYSTGALVLRAERKNVFDIGVSGNVPFLASQSICLDLISREEPDFIIAHEEFAAISAAFIAGIPCLLSSSWIPPPMSIGSEAISYANALLLLFENGLFSLPKKPPETVLFSGTPSLGLSHPRRAVLSYTRGKLGLENPDRRIVYLGANEDDDTYFADMLLSAFVSLRILNKRLIWIAAPAQDWVRNRFSGIAGVAVQQYDKTTEKFLLEADVVISRADRFFTINSLERKVPTVTLLTASNPFEDRVTPRHPRNTIIYTETLSSNLLRETITKSINARNRWGHTTASSASHSNFLRAAKFIETQINTLCSKI